MPTATLTLTSADIAGDPVNVSKTSTCYKAGTTTPLDETAGLNKIILTTTTNKELYIATAGGNDLAAKMYICNKSIVPSICLLDISFILRLPINLILLNNLATFGVEFIADLTDPIGFASLFFPVTRLATVARATAKVGKYTPYLIGGIEATGSMLIPLTPGYFASKEFDYSFTPADYGVSLAGGAILGGTLRKFLFSREMADLESIGPKLDHILRETDADLRNQKIKSEDTVQGSPASKAEAHNTPEANAENRKKSTVDQAYEIADPQRINAIHELYNNDPRYSSEYLGRISKLDEAKEAHVEFDTLIKEINSVLEETGPNRLENANKRLQLVKIRNNIEEYKKIAKGAVERLQNEHKKKVGSDTAQEINEQLNELSEPAEQWNVNQINSRLREFVDLDKKDTARIGAQEKSLKNALGRLVGEENWKNITGQKRILAALNKKIKDLLPDETLTRDEIVDIINDVGDNVDMNAINEHFLKINENYHSSEQSASGISYEEVETYHKLQNENKTVADEIEEESYSFEKTQASNDELILQTKNHYFYRENINGFADKLDEYKRQYDTGEIGVERLGDNMQQLWDDCLGES